MNIREIKALQQALRSGGPLKSRAKIWQALHRDYGLGSRLGPETVFSAGELQQLRQMYQKKKGIENILSIPTDGSRDDFAQQDVDEKISNRPVFEGFVWLACAYPIVTKAGNARVPAGSLVAVQQQHITLDNVSHLILVENGSPIIRWQEIKLPKDFTRPLFVYRGHTQSLNYVLQLFQRAQCRKVAFVDIDPKGLVIASCEIPCDSILLPLNWQQSLPPAQKNPAFTNKTATFLDQEKVLIEQMPQLNAKAKGLGEFILNHKVAVMQEHLMASKLELVVYSLTE